MTFYCIRHIKSGELFPEVKTRGGYSHWNPDNPDMPIKIFKGVPRLFESSKRAKKCIVEWFACQNGRRSGYQTSSGEWDDIVDTKEDGRKKEDLEVVEIQLVIKT
jgi:hypothetical protein